MKRVLSVLISAILCLSCVAMVGCGVEGEYSFYGVMINGQEYKEGDIFTITIDGKAYNMEITEEEFGGEVFELARDGVYKVNEEAVEGARWEEKEGVLTIYSGDVAIATYTVDGRKLIGEKQGGIQVIYKR